MSLLVCSVEVEARLGIQVDADWIVRISHREMSSIKSQHQTFGSK